MAYLLELAFMTFDQKKFQQCENLCAELLLIDPHYSVALDLLDDARKAAERPEYFQFVDNKLENWRKWMDSDEEASVPYAEQLRIPSREEWRDYTARTKCTWVVRPEPELDNPRLSLSLTNATLEDAVARVMEVAKGPFVLDDRLRSSFDWERRVTLHTGEITVREALDTLCSLFGIAWTLTDEAVIFLTSAS